MLRKLQTSEDFIEKYGLDRNAIKQGAKREYARIQAYELSEIRRSLGITQQEMAKQMGVSQKRISDIENGRPGAIQVNTLSRYAHCLGGALKLVFTFPLADSEKTQEIAVSP